MEIKDIMVFDLEANGLLEDATQLWCGVAYWRDEWYEATWPNEDYFIEILNSATYICGHNIIDYDLPLLEKLYGWCPDARVLDTLVLSRLLNPERSGGHSLDSWGQRVGVGKPVHEDWTTFSEDMLHRCKEDVKINVRALELLLREGELNAEDLEELPVYRVA